MPISVDRRQWRKLGEVSSRISYYRKQLENHPEYTALAYRVMLADKMILAVPQSRKHHEIYLNNEIDAVISYLEAKNCPHKEFLTREYWSKFSDGACRVAALPLISIFPSKKKVDRMDITKMTTCKGSCHAGGTCRSRNIPADFGRVPNCYCDH